MLFAPTAQHVSSLTTGNQHRPQSLLSVRCGDHDKSKIQTNIGNHEQNRLQATQQFKAKNSSGNSINVLHRLKSELLTYLECRSGNEHEVNLPTQFCKAEIDRNELFNSMDGIKVQVDAINLTSSGGKNMDLLKSPVFTLECRLSNELIDQVPRYEMFNIMQFECDNFQISNQCARFDQSCVRKVSLPMFLDKETTCESNLGFLHFTVWWRESGSCLNELLGMGTLHLIEFYKHSTLKQYKRILIRRYGQCLAYLYVKISILIDIQKLESTINFRNNSLLKSQRIRKAAEENETSKSTTAHQKRETSVVADTTNANTDKYIINSDLQKSDYSSPMSTENSRSASKVRLLKGFLHVNVMRQQSTVVDNTNMEYYLKCRCFWQDDAVIKVGLPDESYLTNFHFFEQFAVINDENFLNRVERQYLELEIWNGNPEWSQAVSNKKSEFLGVVRLSLHQFFIAYRDEVITNHLCKGKLPVTSVDGWVPLESAIAQRNDKMMEVKCLLAVGSEEQIMNLRQTRGLIANELNQAKYTPNSSSQCANTVNSATTMQRKAKKKSKHENKPSNNYNNNNDNTNYFTIEMHIRDGMQFPLQVLAKKGKKKNSKDAGNKVNLQVEPSTYVSFQPLSVLSSNMRTYKSQDGYVFATKVAEKTTQPQWQEKFKAQIEIDYLHNKLFLLKVWQKAISAKCSTTHSIHPTPMQDEIIGYATLNLQAFLFGKNVDGYSQVTDLNGCQVGLLNIGCRPVETIAELQRRVQMKFCGNTTSLPAATVETAAEETDNFETFIPADIEHLDLGQALRKKMCELEVISTRLRSRLTLVTGGGHAKNTKINLSFPSETDDEIERIEAEVAEFEHDINTEFIEDT